MTYDPRPGTGPRGLRWGGMTIDDGRILVDEVRAAAKRHGRTWELLVPDPWTVNVAAEADEEAAYAEMAVAKRRLRDHICETYGISIRELGSLAMP